MVNKMAKSKYWNREYELIFLEQDEEEKKKFLKKIDQLYKETKDQIETEIEAFLDRYFKGMSPIYSNLRKKLTEDELKKFKKRINKYYLKIASFGKKEYNSNYKTKLKDFSDRVSVSYEDEITIIVNQIMFELLNNLIIMFKEYLVNIYANSYYHSVYTIDVNTDLKDQLFAIDFDYIEGQITKEWLGNNFINRLIIRTNMTLTQMLQNTFSYFMLAKKFDLVKELSDKLDVHKTSSNNNGSYEIANTSTDFIVNLAILQSFRNTNVVDSFEFSAIIDEFTSDICLGMDGRIFKLSEAKPGINIPPLHNHCRSIIIPKISEDKIVNKQGYLEFEDWLRKYAEDYYKTRLRR